MYLIFAFFSLFAVLVAIAIPIFTAQLEKSREATDKANVRSAYAELVADYLTWDGTSAIAAIEVPAKQTQNNWQSDGNAATTTISEGKAGEGIEVPFVTAPNNYTVSINTADGTVTVSAP